MSAEQGITPGIIEVRYDILESPEFLSPDEGELLARARDAMDRAYAPYSHFHVGAAVRLKDGTIVIGSNFENAAYGSTICAERAALLEVNNHGWRDQIAAIAVIGSGLYVATKSPVSPCGACRQVMNEFADLNINPIPLITSGMTDPIYRYPILKMLLPHSFGPADLGR